MLHREPAREALQTRDGADGDFGRCFVSIDGSPRPHLLARLPKPRPFRPGNEYKPLAPSTLSISIDPIKARQAISVSLRPLAVMAMRLSWWQGRVWSVDRSRPRGFLTPHCGFHLNLASRPRPGSTGHRAFPAGRALTGMVPWLPRSGRIWSNSRVADGALFGADSPPAAARTRNPATRASLRPRGFATFKARREATAFVAKRKRISRAARFMLPVHRGSHHLHPEAAWLEATAGRIRGARITPRREAQRLDGVESIGGPGASSILVRNLVLAASDRPGAADELSAVSAKLSSAYSTGKFVYNGKPVRLEDGTTYATGQRLNLDPDAERILRESRDPAVLRAVWEGWRTVSAPMKPDYQKLVELANEGAKSLGYADTGVMWRSKYDGACAFRR